MTELPNLNYINTLSDGDQAFRQQLITIIKTEFPEEKHTYETFIAESNFKKAADSVHKIKHKISILGLENSYETAVSYEEQLLEGSTKGKTDFETILQHITTFIQTL